MNRKTIQRWVLIRIIINYVIYAILAGVVAAVFDYLAYRHLCAGTLPLIWLVPAWYVWGHLLAGFMIFFVDEFREIIRDAEMAEFRKRNRLKRQDVWIFYIIESLFLSLVFAPWIFLYEFIVYGVPNKWWSFRQRLLMGGWRDRQ